MSAFLARVGRAALITVAVAAGVVAVGLLDNPRASHWWIVAAAVVCLLAACLAYLAGELRRAPSMDRHTEPVPGGAIGWTTIPGSCDYGDVAVYPADPNGPVDLGTVSPMMLGQLRAAPDALHLRVRASLLGGVR